MKVDCGDESVKSVYSVLTLLPTEVNNSLKVGSSNNEARASFYVLSENSWTAKIISEASSLIDGTIRSSLPTMFKYS
jgi:hypothetical protein